RKYLGKINSLSEENISPQLFAERISDLITFIESHFQREELIMSLCDFPSLSEHIQKHRAFIADLLRQEKDWLESPSAERSVNIRVMLCEWWNTHIEVSDKK
ncbi:MAG: hypothetical protein B0A82_08935, partial [Alkalinema sp. CACIAM 70d]